MWKVDCKKYKINCDKITEKVIMIQIFDRIFEKILLKDGPKFGSLFFDGEILNFLRFDVFRKTQNVSNFHKNFLSFHKSCPDFLSTLL